MTPPASPAVLPADAAARRLLQTHFEARRYADGASAAGALVVPARLAGSAALRAVAALAIACSFGLLASDAAARARACVQRALGRTRAHWARADPDSVLAWCTAGAEWCEREGLDEPFGRLQALAEVADARPGATPAARVHWRIASAWHHEAFGRRREVAALLGEARQLADASGELGLQIVVRLKLARLALYRDDPAAARECAAWVAIRADADDAPLWLADVADVEARAALVAGDMHRALHQARRACALADLAQAPPAYTLTYRTNEAYAMMGLGAWADALVVLQGMAAVALPARLHDRVVALADLAVLLRADRIGPWTPADDLALEALLARLRALDWPGVLAVLPVHLARLWARALDAGLEVDWVRASIVGRDLPPPEASWPEAWPWPLRVRVLGPLQLTDGDGAPLSGPGKAAAKPLALLRRLAGEGGHGGVSAERLAQALWPGEGREGRDKAMEVTLARLRRLLGRPDAVLLHAQRLQLNPGCVWLDRTALERELAVLAAVPGAGEAERERAWSRILALWRGPLLADEGDAEWLQPLRRGLRQRLAAALLADRARPGQPSWCLRALAADPGLAEWLVSAPRC